MQLRLPTRRRQACPAATAKLQKYQVTARVAAATTVVNDMGAASHGVAPVACMLGALDPVLVHLAPEMVEVAHLVAQAATTVLL